ncbi:MAG: hypothetical protein HFG31_00360 [Eubacterium sp.]|nr:hypothetical protein [Eubacterium sp.]
MKHFSKHIIYCTFLFSAIMIMSYRTDAAVTMPDADNEIIVTPQSTPRETYKSLQNALDSARNNDTDEYTKIILESGKTYYIDVPLQMYSNTIIEAEGAVIEKSYNTAPSKTTGLLCNAPDSSIGGYDLAENLYIHGGTWTGGDLAGATSYGSNIIFAHVNGLFIWDADIKSVYYGHLIELNAVNNAVIDNCKFSGFYSPNTSVGAENAIQLDISAEDDDNIDSPDHISVPSGYKNDDYIPCRNITITNNDFNQNPDSGLGYFPSAIGANKILVRKKKIYMENITISNNNIVNVSYVAILARGFKNSSIKNNIITNSGRSAITADKWSGGFINGNTITTSGSYGIYMENSFVTSIDNNTIKNCDNFALDLNKSTTDTIRNNIIDNCKKSGILISTNSVVNQNIEGNIIKNLTGETCHGIYVYGGKVVNKIINNTISNISTNGIYILKGSAGDIMNNKINNTTASGIALSGSTFNILSSNSISKCERGIRLSSGSNGTKIEANTFTNCITPLRIPSGCNVISSDITPNQSASINVKSILITKKFTIGVRESIRLKPVILPDDATNKSVTYSSSKKSVATVNAYGKVTGKKAGKTIITIKSADGVIQKVKITVKKAPKKIFFSKKTLKLKRKKSKKLKIKFPKGTASYKITWKFTNKKFISVSADGTVKALKKGVSIITATTYNKKKARIKIIVQ